eukprot:4965148-Prymnesium_polylepis.1
MKQRSQQLEHVAKETAKDVTRDASPSAAEPPAAEHVPPQSSTAAPAGTRRAAAEQAAASAGAAGSRLRGGKDPSPRAKAEGG